MEQQKNLLENELIIDSTITGHLKETIMWAKFLGIAGYIISGLIAVGAIVVTTFLTRQTGRYSGSSDMGIVTGGSVMVVYLLVAAVVFFMSRFLFQFAKKAQTALRTSDQENLASAFKNLKVYFRFAGIISILGVIFSILGAIGLMLAASFSRY